MDAIKNAVEKIKATFGAEVISVEESAKQTFICVRHAKILAILRILKEDFDYLQDICGVDYLNKGMPERFAVVYNLYSFKNNAHFRVKAFVPEENPEIDSATPLWKAADWAEREAYDLYGIIFKGHPNLKRLLLPDNYQGHPLRKDYPLRGMGERDDFPKYTVTE